MTPKKAHLITLTAVVSTTGTLTASTWPSSEEILHDLRLANTYFEETWPDPGDEIVTNRARPSNIWTRATYYEGLLALYSIDPNPAYYDYAVRWAEAHRWGLRDGAETRNADNQCCGQTYIELYQIDPQPVRIHDIKASIDGMMQSRRIDDWWWIDAIQMAMPVFAKLGTLLDDRTYHDRMNAMFLYAKNMQGGGGLFNAEDGLWWRDRDFVPPHTTSNNKNRYWSRGNGWVIAAMARVLDALPDDSIYRREYEEMLQTMAHALVPLQRADGFWNVSLHDPEDFGGKETSGTAFFAYGLAWGVRHGVLDESTFRPVITRAWDAITNEALHPNGFLGYVQGTGKEPKDGQPVTYDQAPDFEDYALGAFLLAGSEVYRLANAQAATSKIE